MLRFILLTGLYLLGTWYADAFIGGSTRSRCSGRPPASPSPRCCATAGAGPLFIPVAVLIAHLTFVPVPAAFLPFSVLGNFLGALAGAYVVQRHRRAAADQRGQRLRHAARRPGDGAGVGRDRHRRPGVLGHGAAPTHAGRRCSSGAWATCSASSAWRRPCCCSARRGSRQSRPAAPTPTTPPPEEKAAVAAAAGCCPAASSTGAACRTACTRWAWSRCRCRCCCGARCASSRSGPPSARALAVLFLTTLTGLGLAGFEPPESTLDSALLLGFMSLFGDHPAGAGGLDQRAAHGHAQGAAPRHHRRRHQPAQPRRVRGGGAEGAGWHRRAAARWPTWTWTTSR